MAVAKAIFLIRSNSQDLHELLNSLIAVAQDKGYLSGRDLPDSTIEELNDLIAQLRDRILEVTSES